MGEEQRRRYQPSAGEIESDRLRWGEIVVGMKKDLDSIREDLHELRDLFTDSGGQIRKLQDFKLQLETQQAAASEAAKRYAAENEKAQETRHKTFVWRLSLAVAVLHVVEYAITWIRQHP